MPPILSDNTPGFLLGSREASRPNSGWVHIGVGLAAGIYTLLALFDIAFCPPLAPLAVQEQLAAVLLCLSFLLCPKRPRAAILLSYSVVFLEMALSHLQAQRMQASSMGAVPVLVIAAGMLFGSQGALSAAVAGGLGLPLAVYASGGWGYRFGSFDTVADGGTLLVFESSVFGTAVLVVSVMRSYYSVLRDTEQMRRRFEELFANAPDGLVSLDAGGRIADINPAAAQIFGMPLEQLRGMAFFDLLGCAGARHRPDLTVPNADVPVTLELHPVQGPFRSLEISVRALAGTEPRTLLVIRDGTRKRVMDERLGHAQRLESVGRLAGGVAHDFNNLLTVVQGNAGMLKEHADPEVRAQARDILEAGARGALLTHQLLAFARREAHHPAALDLGKVVSDMQRLLERVCGEQHRIVLDAVPEAYVLADITQIEQVVVNLVSNARDAMPLGGSVEIRVRSHSFAGARDLGSSLLAEKQVLLEVSDHGVGMSAEVKSRIFEPFFTTKPRGKGTGLGLASVHGVIAQNRGAIWVDSEQGKGTRFRIFFALENAPASLPVSCESHASPPKGDEHVLIVEDEAQVRILGRHILQRAGYRISEAADAREAFAALRRDSDISLVVSDVRMPGLSGPEMAEEIHKTRPGLPVLFMSGHANLSREGRGELTMQNLIRKPFTADEFLRRVRERLEARRRVPQPSSPTSSGRDATRTA